MKQTRAVLHDPWPEQGLVKTMRIAIETTPQPKNIAYTTDVGLLPGSRRKSSCTAEWLKNLWSKIWSFLIFLASLIPEAETELKVRVFCFRDHRDARFFREEEIVEAVGNGIVEEVGNSKEPSCLVQAQRRMKTAMLKFG